MIGMILSVGAGGALGAISRYMVGIALAARFGSASWMAILLTNILGCFLMGLLAAYIHYHIQLSEPIRGFLAVGFLGGLTTFSTFALDAYGFWLRGDILGGISYIALSVLLSLTAFGLGIWLLRAGLPS